MTTNNRDRGNAMAHNHIDSQRSALTRAAVGGVFAGLVRAAVTWILDHVFP
ncbi:hypothetical protein [Nocardia sp. NPDC005745]|uniref:hypothetical protein n=1 Tax=Nocardia sp. NPDC005745 TaxID=3157061 RepID=UPI0033F3106D